MRKIILVALISLLGIGYLAGCESGSKVDNAGDGGSDTDTDADTDTDTDTDADSDTDADADTDTEVEFSYIWISNTGEHTLSKVDTQTAVEVARYLTCPYSYCDPSRTSVNLHGDMVVLNRQSNGGGLPSSATKFAASLDDCVDNNGNSVIDTSTGPTDVLPWGEDECMLWHTELPTNLGAGDGGRAAAWDGKEDPETGLGGNVWLGICDMAPTTSSSAPIFKLNGDTGAIVVQITIPTSCAYGAAMDGNDNLWITDRENSCMIRLNTITLSLSPLISLPCCYGISVDSQGRVWTAGPHGTPNCVSRYDPSTDSFETLDFPGNDLRHVAVGLGKSEGYVWLPSIESPGNLYKVNQETLILEGTYPTGDGHTILGAAVDFEGYVWTVAYSGLDWNEIHKFDPDTETSIDVPIGLEPYTYSDMTGMQLKGVIIVE